MSISYNIHEENMFHVSQKVALRLAYGC